MKRSSDLILILLILVSGLAFYIIGRQSILTPNPTHPIPTTPTNQKQPPKRAKATNKAPSKKQLSSKHPSHQKGCTLIQGARLYTMTTQAMRGDIAWQGERILALGSSLKHLKKKCKVIDGSTSIVTPGFSVSNTALGLVEVMMVPHSRNDKMFSPHDIKPGFRVFEGFHPQSVTIPAARLSGITQAEISPRDGLLAGQSALISLGGPKGARVEHAPLAIHAGFGSGWKGSTAHAWLKLREALDDARTYHANKAAYQAGKLRHLSLSRIHLEALSLVITRKLPLVLRLQRSTEIRRAIHFAKKQRIRLILSGVAEGWMVAKELAAAKIPVLIGPAHNLPRSFNLLNSRLDNAAILANAGVHFAFRSLGRSHFVRNSTQEVGIMVANGLPYEAALRGLSRNFFEIYGVKGYGTLEPQQFANIVLWNGDPLELSSRPSHIWIHGHPIPMHSRQTQLRDRYRVLPQRKEHDAPYPY